MCLSLYLKVFGYFQPRDPICLLNALSGQERAQGCGITLCPCSSICLCSGSLTLPQSLYHRHEGKGEGHEQRDLCSRQRSRLVPQLPGQLAEVRGRAGQSVLTFSALCPFHSTFWAIFFCQHLKGRGCVSSTVSGAMNKDWEGPCSLSSGYSHEKRCKRQTEGTQ